MKIKVAYYGHCRKDGSYNMVAFDTETKTFVNWDGGHSEDATLVEAKLSRDVDMLREKLEEDGYRNINGNYGNIHKTTNGIVTNFINWWV